MIYLAGTTADDWREKLLHRHSLESYDIMGLQGLPLDEIAKIELEWLRECTALLAYFPESNLSGIGLATELGYAKALGKPTVLVSGGDHRRVNWLKFIPDYYTISMEEGIQWLQEKT